MRLRKPADIRQQELRNLVAGSEFVRPDTPSVGQIIFNSTTLKFEGFDGLSWVTVSGAPVAGGDSLEGEPGIGVGILGDIVHRGAPLVLADVGGIATLKAASAANDTIWDVAGLAGQDGIVDQTIIFRTAGPTLTDILAWDVTPLITEVGHDFYLSDNAGKLTLTPPSTVGHRVLRLGTVVDVQISAIEVTLDMGEGIIL